MKRNRTRKFSAFLATLCLLVWTEEAETAPEDQEVFTSFEQFSTQSGVPFSIGSGQEIATFSGDAFADRIGDGSLYRTGLKAWMVNPNAVGEIVFETNAAVVEFYARAGRFASGDTVIRALADDGRTVGGPVTLPPGQGFTLVSFSGNIDRVRVENLALSGLNGIDDFGFTPIDPLFGDYNNDGVVDAADYTVWRDNLGAPADTLPNDEHSGPIGQDQYDTWRSNFGASTSAAAPSLVTSAAPEPAALVLLVGLAALPWANRAR